jgi:undecaprenyl-diphosphatase
MELLAAAILGIVQGLTEFLPISSSAHLILIPWLFGWKSEGIAFDVSLHVGTALAILAYFWRDWWLLGREMTIGLATGRPLGNFHRKLAWMLVVGTIPAAVVGLLFENQIESTLRDPRITVFTLACLAAVLYLADRFSRKERALAEFGWADSLWIGASQALALIPGVSRSGITMTTAMLRNSDRPSAARFSFLLSTPVIVGAGIVNAWHLFKAAQPPVPFSSSVVPEAAPVQWAVFAVGTLFAAVFGSLCIHYFLRYLQKGSFLPFVVYRFILAAIVLVFYLRSA